MAFNARLNFSSQSTNANEPHQLDRATAYSVDQDPALEIKSAGTALWRIVWNSGTNKFRVTVGEWAATAIAAIYGGTGLTSYTLGDLLYSSAANTLAKLAGNTTATKMFLSQTGNGTISAAPGWETIESTDITDFTAAVTTVLGSVDTAVMARVYRSGSDQSFGAGADTKIQFNAETGDPQGTYDAVTNYRYLPTTAGWYEVKAQFTENSADSFTSYRRIYIYKNGAEYCRVQDFLGTSNPTISISDVVYLNGSTDYVEIFAFGGDAVSILLGSTLSFASFARIGA